MKVINPVPQMSTDTIVLEMSRKQFGELISVVSAAKGAAIEGGTDFFKANTIVDIFNFFDAFKNMEIVRTL